MTAKAYKGIAMEGPIAGWYSRITSQEERHRSVAEQLATGLPAGSRVLEIAPGPGYTAIALARMGDYRITGLDISKSFVEMAGRNARQAGVEIDFRQGNASELPFAPESFDLTYCQAAFKNFTQPVQAIAEMYRVLRPGGRSVIIDLRGDALPAEIDRHIETLGIHGINRLITRWTFRSFLLKNAYSIAEVQAMVTRTPFQKTRVDPDDIGFTLWLEK